LPFGTLTVNLIGSFLLGLLAGLALSYSSSSTAKTVIGTGFCGGLTTWSTASWETVRLVEEGFGATAARFMAVNLLASAAAGGLGLLLTLH
jgi:fluoride exporter